MRPNSVFSADKRPATKPNNRSNSNGDTVQALDSTQKRLQMKANKKVVTSMNNQNDTIRDLDLAYKRSINSATNTAGRNSVQVQKRKQNL